MGWRAAAERTGAAQMADASAARVTMTLMKANADEFQCYLECPFGRLMISFHGWRDFGVQGAGGQAHTGLLTAWDLHA